MSKTIGIIDEPVAPGSKDDLDINFHSDVKAKISIKIDKIQSK